MTTLSTWQTRFDSDVALQNGNADSSIATLRRSAFERFATAGLPTMRDEEWRYTNPNVVTGRTWRQAEPVTLSKEEIAPLGLDDPNAHRLVLINGRLAAEHSNIGALPSGVTVTGLAASLVTDAARIGVTLAGYPEYQIDQFVDLNTALFTDGLYLHVADDAALDAPIHVLHIAANWGEDESIHSRSLIVLGRNARATVIEEFVAVGDVSHFSNPLTEIALGDGARLDHYRIQNEGENAAHVGSLLCRQGRDSTLTQITVSFGSSLVRNHTCVVLNGEGGHTTMDGVAVARGTETIDNHTTLDHAVANCTSHELYKHVLADRGHGVFSGRIMVRLDAQKTDSKQSNRTLLLSDEATIDAKPQLEIFADDVKCTHGAAIGQLDDEQMFYLRSRGIPVEQSRALLIYAFAEEIIERIELQSLRYHLEQLLETRLGR